MRCSFNCMTQSNGQRQNRIAIIWDVKELISINWCGEKISDNTNIINEIKMWKIVEYKTQMSKHGQANCITGLSGCYLWPSKIRSQWGFQFWSSCCYTHTHDCTSNQTISNLMKTPNITNCNVGNLQLLELFDS